MLNNLTNFFNLIVGRRIKTQLEPSDLIAVGTKQSPALGDYKPTAIQFSDLQAQLGGGSSYKVYTALLTQTGTDAPVATVLENTIGNITWEYFGTGIYNCKSIGNFIGNKTHFLGVNGFTPQRLFCFSISDDNDTVQISITDLTGAYVDSSMYLNSIEIRVYN
jgi:hypothetical protein